MKQDTVGRSTLRAHFESLVDLDPAGWSERVRELAVPQALRERLLLMLLLDRIRGVPEAQRPGWLAGVAQDAGVRERVRRSLRRAGPLDGDAAQTPSSYGPIA